MITFHFYYKIDTKNYSEIYVMHLLKRQLQKLIDDSTDEEIDDAKYKIEIKWI